MHQVGLEKRLGSSGKFPVLVTCLLGEGGNVHVPWNSDFLGAAGVWLGTYPHFPVMEGALLPQERAVQGAALLFLDCICAKSVSPRPPASAAGICCLSFPDHVCSHPLVQASSPFCCCLAFLTWLYDGPQESGIFF